MPRCPLQARLCLPMPGIPLPSLPTAKQQQHRPSPQLVLSSKNQRDEDELTAQSHRRLLRCVPSKRRHSARVNGRRRMLERPALRCVALELHDDTSARRGAAEKTRDETTTERGTSVFFLHLMSGSFDPCACWRPAWRRRPNQEPDRARGQARPVSPSRRPCVPTLVVRRLGGRTHD